MADSSNTVSDELFASSAPAVAPELVADATGDEVTAALEYGLSMAAAVATEEAPVGRACGGGGMARETDTDREETN